MASEIRPFGDLFAEPTRNGLTRPKAVRGSGVKMANMGELFAHSRLCNVPMERVPLSQSEAERFLLEDGDLLFARQSLVLKGAGKCSLFLRDDEPVTFESHVTRVRLDPQKAHPGYYFYYLQSHHGQSAIRSIVEQGAGASGIRGSDLATLEVRWQPLATQHSIAHVLGTLDDKIELNRRMSETLEAMARALFKSWFVDFEPVRAKMEDRWRRGESLPGLPAEHYDLFPDRLVDSELGEIPEGWEVGSFNEVVVQLRDNENPATSSDAVFSHFSIPAHDEGQMPKHELGENIKSAKTRVPPNVVLLSKLNPEIDASGWWTWWTVRERYVRPSSWCFGPTRHFNAVTSTASRAPLSFAQQMESLVTGTSKSHQRAPANAILSLRAVIPSARVIETFELSASELLSRGAILRKESRALAAQRDALLPKLVSGKVQM